MGSILKGFGLNGSEHRRHRPTLFDRHPGQAIVLIAVLMVVLIGFTGLAVDGGELYFLQKNVQNAADAAVLAGLYEICSDPSRTLIAAHDAAQTNIEVAVADNGFYDVDGIEAADMTDGVDIFYIHPANPDFPNAPDTPGAGMTSNYLVVKITATKPARLIQLVYQGPLQVTATAAGKCSPVQEWTQGKAIMGIGPCSSGPGGNHDSVEFNGSHVVINGGLMGNGGVSLTSGGGGNQSSINGGSSASGSNGDNGNINYNPPAQSNQPILTVPQFWDINHFKPGGKIAVWAATVTVTHPTAAYFSATGNVTDWSQFSPNPIDGVTHQPKDGIYYVAGSLTFNNADFKTSPGNDTVDLNGKTFVATGDISFSINDNNYMVPYQIPAIPPGYEDVLAAGTDKLPLLFTTSPQPGLPPSCYNSNSNNNLSIGSAMSFLGAIYAPYGECVFSGSSSVTAQGALLCYRVNLSGSDFQMSYDPDVFPPPPPTVGVTG